jgi:DNA-binding NarL/FixJ family response regulator
VKLNLLIAEPHDILRRGLCTIFIEDESVEQVYEVATREDLEEHLQANSLDLLIVNQSLLPDVTLLPSGRFVILTPEFDVITFKIAYEHKARGYLLQSTSVELLKATLRLAEGAFLIEPALTAQIMQYIFTNSRFAVKEELLTPREREIMALLREGIDRYTIAQQLHISEATLKTHIKNIARKRESVSLISSEQ